MAVGLVRTTVDAPITQTNLTNGLVAALQNAGLGTPHSYTSGGERRVFPITFSSATLGTCHFEFLVTSGLTLSCRAGTSFNTTTNTMSANPATSANNMTFNTSTSVNFIAMDCGGEGFLVLLFQGTNVGALSVIRPSIGQPAWWDEAVYPYFFMNKNITGSLFLTTFETTGGTAQTPWSGTNSLLHEFQPANLRGVNPLSQREVSPGLTLQSQAVTNAGIAGLLSANFGRAATSGAAVTDIIRIGSQQWLIIRVESAGAGLVARIL